MFFLFSLLVFDIQTFNMPKTNDIDSNFFCGFWGHSNVHKFRNALS